MKLLRLKEYRIQKRVKENIKNKYYILRKQLSGFVKQLDGQLKEKNKLLKNIQNI